MAAQPAPALGREGDPRWVAYAGRGMWSVPGYAYRLTMYLLAEVDRVQQELGVAGHLGEIGVYQGRTLIALGLLARPGERVAGIDNFELLPDAGDDFGPLGAHLKRWLGDRAAVRVVRGDSTALSSADLLAASGGPYRIFQVDGDHSAAAVKHDLATAAAAIAEGGVLVADDVLNELYPAVNDGARAFIAAQPADGFVPFLLGGGRTFLARRAAADVYRARVMPGLHGYVAREDTFMGEPVRCASLPWHFAAEGRGYPVPRPPRPRWLQAYRLLRRTARRGIRRIGQRSARRES
jgi:hypothetical protein